jgi:predicted nucleic-acid-binding Zn-ribbon protein
MAHEDDLNNDPTLLSGLGEPAEPLLGRGHVRVRTGQELACVVCGGRVFAGREVLLNTAGMTLMNLDWANKAAVAAVCLACGYVHSFLDGDLTWGS